MTEETLMEYKMEAFPIDEEEDSVSKPHWTDSSTKIFIEQFKANYDLWKIGKIMTKKKMWEKIAENVNAHGYMFTVDQVQNRFKTLRRRFKSANIPGTSSRKEREFPYQNELSDIFGTDMPLQQQTVTIIREDESQEAVERILNGQEQEEESEEQIQARRNHGESRRHKQPQNAMEVLLELKELIKKVEIRRQTRHEQNYRLAKQRNEILQRKNELLEQILMKMM